MIILIWVLGFLFFMFSIIDLKFNEIPSVFLTGTLFMILALNPSNLFFGILAFVFAWLLYDFDFIGGIADIKIIVMIGLMLTSFINSSIFMVIIVLYGTIWKILIKKVFKKKEMDFAFVPVLFCVYLTLVLAGLM